MNSTTLSSSSFQSENSRCGNLLPERKEIVSSRKTLLAEILKTFCQCVASREVKHHGAGSQEAMDVLALVLLWLGGPITGGKGSWPLYENWHLHNAEKGCLSAAKRSMTDNHLKELVEAATKTNAHFKKDNKGLEVKDMQLHDFMMNYVPDIEIWTTLIIHINFSGKSFIHGDMEITVVSEITTSIRMAALQDHMILLPMCNVNLINVKTNLPNNTRPKTVNKFLNSTLGKALTDVMCPAADKVGQMQKQFEFLGDAQPIGNQGNVTYSLRGSPNITSDHAHICFKTRITRADGEEIETPTEPPALDVLPELPKENSDLSLPVNVLNAVMELHKDILDQEVFSDTGGPEVNRDVLVEKVPSIEIPEGDLMFEIRSTETPTWALEPGVATLKDPLKIELKTRPEKENLFIVTATLKISTAFQVANRHLQISLGENSLEDLALESSSVGDFDPELLNGYLLDILRATLVEDLKKALENRLPLPNMMDADYGGATIEIERNTLRAVLTSECS